VRWGNFGREEALFAVQVMDRLFGRRLFSAQRMIVVAIAAVFVLCGLTAAIILLGVPLHWYKFKAAHLPWTMLMLLSVAVSFSITRFFAIQIARILPNSPYLNSAGIFSLVFLQYILLCYWSGFVESLGFAILTFYETAESVRSFIDQFLISIPVVARYSLFDFTFDNTLSFILDNLQYLNLTHRHLGLSIILLRFSI
jgi:hypothetical protein